MKSIYTTLLILSFSFFVQAEAGLPAAKKATVSNNCIGEAGKVNFLAWRELGSGDINKLYEHPNYPTMPDSRQVLTKLQAPINYYRHFGATITGFIKPSVSGGYTFNVTADDEGYFFISTNDDPANLVQQSYLTEEVVDIDSHDQFPTQTSGTINLNADTYYYFELHYSNTSWKDNATVYWKTPINTDWNIIPNVNLYSNDCGLTCFPEGTACDDKNPNTINDAYDANCECVGTPCVGADCGLNQVYDAYGACDATEKLSQNPADSWTSCQVTTSPNAARAAAHWIQYDFGQTYSITSSHIWNYNIAGQTNLGFKDVVIDYSINGTDWMQLGVYNWPQAIGNINYEGFDGPAMTGIAARYILVTALSNWGSSNCAGFSQISFNVENCPSAGVACDDGDPSTIQDNFNVNCECEGVGIAVNDCREEDLVHNNVILLAANHDVNKTITSAGIVMNGTKLNYVAGECITLLPGFQAQAGSDFLATILACNSTIQEEDTSIIASREAKKIAETAEMELPEKTLAKETLVKEEIGLTASTTPYELSTSSAKAQIAGKVNLAVMPNPTKSLTTITFELPNASKTSLSIYSVNGQLVSYLANNTNFSAGVHTKRFPAQQLDQGMYFIVLKTEQEVVTKTFVVIE